MSIIIKDVNLPKSCGVCDFIMGCPVWRNKWVRYEDRLWYMENRDVCCPMDEADDVVEVVRCRDCDFFGGNAQEGGCQLNKCIVKADDYCSRWESTSIFR